jgi:hypothetical protein
LQTHSDALSSQFDEVLHTLQVLALSHSIQPEMHGGQVKIEPLISLKEAIKHSQVEVEELKARFGVAMQLKQLAVAFEHLAQLI